MIADMQRLETAARMTMGDFEGPSTLPLASPSLFSGRFRAVYVIAAVLAAALLVVALF